MSTDTSIWSPWLSIAALLVWLAIVAGVRAIRSEGAAGTNHRGMAWLAGVSLLTAMATIRIPDQLSGAVFACVLAATTITGATTTWIHGKNDRDRFGGLALLAAVLGLGILFFEDRPQWVAIPLSVTGLSIPAAAWAHRKSKRWTYAFSPDGKNASGSFVFFLASTAVLVVASIGSDGRFHTEISPTTLVFCAVFLTLLEAVSNRPLGWLWIPLATAYWLGLDPHLHLTPYASAVAIAILAVLAHRRGWLSGAGAPATALLGWVLVVNDEPRWVMCALLFFALGTAASKWPGRSPWKSERGRTGFQVFANGGVPIAFIALYHFFGEVSFLVGGLCGLSTALSDTLSSEVGVRAGKPTWAVRRWKPMSPGESGGISWPGLVAGALGAAIMGVTAAALFEDFSPGKAALIAGVGFWGNLLDSLLGDSIQAKYTRRKDSGDAAPREVAHTADEIPISGWKPVDNNVVNLLSTAVASAVGAAMWLWT